MRKILILLILILNVFAMEDGSYICTKINEDGDFSYYIDEDTNETDEDVFYYFVKHEKQNLSMSMPMEKTDPLLSKFLNELLFDDYPLTDYGAYRNFGIDLYVSEDDNSISMHVLKMNYRAQKELDCQKLSLFQEYRAPIVLILLIIFLVSLIYFTIQLLLRLFYRIIGLKSLPEQEIKMKITLIILIVLFILVSPFILLV